MHHHHGTLRLILAITAALIGVIVLIPVVSALTVAGTDDSLSSGEVTVHDGAAALSMDEQIVPFAKTTATIHVHSGQDLFLGTANGVDTDSYLAGIAHEEITGWAVPGKLDTRFIAGKDRPQATPDSRDWWTGKDTGRELTHSFDLSEAPSVIVITPADGKGDLGGTTVSVDVKVKGVFAFCLIGIGVVILAWGAAAFFFIRWYRGRPRVRGSARRGPRGPGSRGRKEAAGAAAAASGASPSASRGAPRARRSATARRSVTTRRVRRGIAWAGLGTLAITAAGCTPLPVAQPQAPRAEGYSKVGMERDKAGAFMSDYVKALNASLAKNGKDLDSLQDDPLLSRTHAEVLIAKSQDKRLSAGSFDSVLAGGPAFSSYPMWFMAFATPTGDAKSEQVMIVRRDSAAGEWKVVQSLFVPRSSVPELAASSAGAVAQAPESHVQAQGKATSALVSYLGAKPGATGSPQGVKTSGEAFSGFRKYIDALASKKGGFKSVGVQCKDADSTNPKLASMALATSDSGSASGGASVGEISCELTAKASSTASVDMGKDVESLITGPKNRTTVKIEFSIPYLLTTQDGSPTVSGTGWFMVAAKTTGKKSQSAATV